MFCQICKEERSVEFLAGGHGGALWLMTECQHKVTLKVGEANIWEENDTKLIQEKYETNS